MKLDLFLISLLTLFLELTCIRWFPSHVLFLTFFTNTVLLACILGIAVGCLAARRTANLLAWTPLAADRSASAARISSSGSGERRTASSTSATRRRRRWSSSASSIRRAIFRASSCRSSCICGYFFLVIALDDGGPGQQLGRALARLPNRLEAYTIDILGSIAGIVLFAACSFLELSPAWWFAFVVVGLDVFPAPAGHVARPPRWPSPCVLVVGLSVAPSLIGLREMWSPYYRISYRPEQGLIGVNLIGHQQMQPLDARFPAYALPHLLNRDCRRQSVQRRADHRRRLGQRRQPRAGVGRRARRRGRDRSGDSTDRQAGSSRIVRTTIRASPCISTTAATS